MKVFAVFDSNTTAAALPQLQSHPDHARPAQPDEIRQRRVLSRVNVSPAVAAVIGSLAFDTTETWRARA